MKQAATLYEEAKVNVNHPKEGPLSPRDYQDRLGVIRGVKLRKGEGLFGDLHFNPKHVLAEQLAWDAEHDPRNVGFSHNVLARLSREDDVTIVEEISQVISVDLVTDPATTQGLFENVKQEGSNEEYREHKRIWKALSMEGLQLHRPDLLQEIEKTIESKWHRQLEQSQAELAALKKQQHIIELLKKYRLPVPEAELTGNENSVVSQAFLATLMNSTEQDVEKLVAERAKLVQSASRWGNQFSNAHGPRSQEQNAFSAANVSVDTSHDFAKRLKSVSN